MMTFVGYNVFSLLGFQITEIPEYRISRGRRIEFVAPIRSEGGVCAVSVSGTKTVFDLVIHKIITLPGDAPRWHRWTISEPSTGRAVAWGRTRQDVLDDLALRIAFYGGEKEFSRMLRDAVMKRREGQDALQTL